MTSVPKVNPGDMVFWHCVCFRSLIFHYFSCERNPQDVVHSVEEEHTGQEDSAGMFCISWFKDHTNANHCCSVMYIGAVPQTPMNTEYVKKQAETFLAGINPPDFVKDKPNTTYVGLGADTDVKEHIARVAMGLPIQVA